MVSYINLQNKYRALSKYFNMVYADLHNHTRRSDGFTEDIVKAAKEQNVRALL